MPFSLVPKNAVLASSSSMGNPSSNFMGSGWGLSSYNQKYRYKYRFKIQYGVSLFYLNNYLFHRWWKNRLDQITWKDVLYVSGHRCKVFQVLLHHFLRLPVLEILPSGEIYFTVEMNKNIKWSFLWSAEMSCIFFSFLLMKRGKFHKSCFSSPHDLSSPKIGRSPREASGWYNKW